MDRREWIERKDGMGMKASSEPLTNGEKKYGRVKRKRRRGVCLGKEEIKKGVKNLKLKMNSD